MNQESRCLMVGLLAFLTGVTAGAMAGLLLAPHSGAYTRRQLQNLAEDLEEGAQSLVDESRRVVKDLVDQGKRLAP